MSSIVTKDNLTYYHNKMKTLLANKSDTSHTHKYAGSSSAGGSANSVANSLTVQFNGTTKATFNGSAAKTVNITPSGIGAANSGHGHYYGFGNEYCFEIGGGEDKGWYKVFTCSDPQITAPSSAKYKACTVYGKICYVTGNHNQSEPKYVDFSAVFYAISGTSVKDVSYLYLPKTFTYDCIRIVKVSTNSWEIQIRQSSSWNKCYIQFAIFNSDMVTASACSPVAATNTTVANSVSNSTVLSAYDYVPTSNYMTNSEIDALF